MNALAKVDTVVHLAAFFRGATDAQTHEVNATGTDALAEQAVQAGVKRFVFVSSSTVYGTGLNRPFREEDQPNPPSRAYPISKLKAESSLMELQRQRALGLRILRVAFVYSEGDPHVAELPTTLKT